MAGLRVCENCGADRENWSSLLWPNPPESPMLFCDEKCRDEWKVKNIRILVPPRNR